MYDSLPFPRGATWYDGEVIDANNLGGEQLEGAEYMVEDTDLQGAQRTERPVKLRIVRNVSGGVLLPKRLVTFQASAGKYGARVDGSVDITAEEAYPVDEFLPTAGVPDDDLFYIVIEGPAVVSNTLVAGATSSIALADELIAATAVTSGATSAGRAEKAVFTGVAQALADQIRHRLGRALTARTTGETGADILVDLGKW